MATLPGMAERTLTISSARQDLLPRLGGRSAGSPGRPPRSPPSARSAVPHLRLRRSLAAPPSPPPSLCLTRYADLASSLQGKRDLVCAALESVGLPVSRPQGTLTSSSPTWPRWLPEQAGSRSARSWSDGAASSAYPCRSSTTTSRRRRLVRFAVCKRDEVLREAVRRIGALRPAGAAGCPHPLFGAPPRSTGPAGALARPSPRSQADAMAAQGSSSGSLPCASPGWRRPSSLRPRLRRRGAR